jgi:uncharacterized DUF497 family protein
MFEWEEARRRENVALYGVDFVRAALMFDNPVLEREDTRRFHGEKRFVSIGHVDGFFMVVTWSPRANRRRIVSAWRADRDDEAIYGATVPYAGRADAGPYPRGRIDPGKLRAGLLARGRAALSLPKPPPRPRAARS